MRERQIVLTERERNALNTVRNRLKVMAGSREELKQLFSRDELQQLGGCKAARNMVSTYLVANELKLAVAEDILAAPTLYGADMRAAYEKRCRELLG